MFIYIILAYKLLNLKYFEFDVYEKEMSNLKNFLCNPVSVKKEIATFSSKNKIFLKFKILTFNN